MIKRYLNEPAGEATFIESTEKSGSGNYRILGKLKAPFFDLNSATRNGRNYSECAEEALQSEEFKEKMANRVFFGRLGHPYTEEECAEDPAVRACVIMTDYKKNPSTNMYEGTLEILDNEYGRQLKSLVDAGCRMGVSTRGAGDSYEASNGEEMIRNYEFENLDVVTMPAVKKARVTVLESFDASKRKKLESIISEATDKYVLESLKMTIEATEMPNKKVLIEEIDKKLSANGTETIESLTEDITAITQKLNETEAKLSATEAELVETKRKLEEFESSAGTTENDDKDASKLTENYVKLLRSSTNLLRDMKEDNRKKSAKISELSESLSKSKKVVEQLSKDNKKLEFDNKSLRESLSKMESLESQLAEKSKKLDEVEVASNNLTESVAKSKQMHNEALSNLKHQVKLLNEAKDKVIAENKSLHEGIAKLKSKYIESVAGVYGIGLESLKLRVNENMSAAQIESAAKSIRESQDARKAALPDISSLGKILESNQAPVVDDPELSRAGRIAQMTKSNL